MCAARQQRYAVFLSGFDYSIEYHNSKANANADSLSRLPLPTSQDNNELEDDTCMYYQDIVESIPVSAKTIAKESRCYKIISKVITFVTNDE
ncbi:Pol polyprotein [Elysia marginata]|uniref:Pol polyprotein n=1 Tax=Elysia marginata TaxID=1093978 RepID=A0AAV4IBT5_9GAST|nr:Pol polyprotein [Elysia marginata]